MKLKTILLTGVSGAIGRLLVSRLLDDFKIIALGTDYSRIPENIRYHKNFKFYEKNLLQIESSKDFNIAEPIDVILHLAGAVSGSKISEVDYFKINAESTRSLVQLANEKRCSGFGLASSVSVYGDHRKSISLLSDRLGKSVYARSKIAAENYCKDCRFPYSIFRIASVYGHGTKSFVSKLFSLFKKGFYPQIRSERKKSLIHVNDLTNCLEKWCRNASEKDYVRPVYILSHPEPVTIASVISEFRNQNKASFSGIAIPIFGVFVPIFNLFYKIVRKIRKFPYHDSPLDSLLFSIEIFDGPSWTDLDLKPKWDLRKGISEYQ